MTIQILREQKLIIFEVITGSHAYGLNISTSDVDIKGVFVLPEEQFMGFDYVAQVNDATNDTVFYELRQFMALLLKNNPNLLEMLCVAPEHIIYKHPLMDFIHPELFLSKLCKDTFAGYAFTQIRKARGLNKKIVNPIAKEKKTPLDFCYIMQGQGAVSVQQWLQNKQWKQQYCGLVNVPHMKGVHALFYDEAAQNGGQFLGFKGIIQKNTSNSISLSAVPKEMLPVAHLFYNKDGYQKYCKDYKAYWSWVENRNEARYENTVAHGKNYDSKNMMHTFRLLDMAAEIAIEKRIVVKRPNREYLLNIRKGTFTYDELVQKAAQKATAIQQHFAQSDLPKHPNRIQVEAVLRNIRREIYEEWRQLFLIQI